MERGPRRGLSDLVILNSAERVDLVVELKFEPDHKRARGGLREIWPTKLEPSVVFWGQEGVLKDIARVRRWTEAGLAAAGVALFVDEGRLFRHREPHPDSGWVDISCQGRRQRDVAVLAAAFGARPSDLIGI
jgi:hypothetical protein